MASLKKEKELSEEQIFALKIIREIQGVVGMEGSNTGSINFHSNQKVFQTERDRTRDKIIRVIKKVGKVNNINL
jgi:hypothetical protein